MSKLKNSRFHIKLIWFFALTVGIVILIASYRYNMLNGLVKDTTNVFDSSEQIIILKEDIEKLSNAFDSHIKLQTEESLNDISFDMRNVNEQLTNIRNEISYSNKGIRIKNLCNMTDSYVELMDKMLKTKTVKDADYKEVNKICEYIREYINELMGEQLVEDTKEYVTIKDRISDINSISYIVLVLVIVGAIGCIIVFSLHITRPIKHLADKTKAVADGNYNLIVYDEEATAEVEELYDNFNIMTRSIKDNVEELKRTKILEQALAEEKINNLNMKNALKEAELTALQAQIDPHFIFNTINIGAQLALLNEDEKTCEYLENVAELFRYNLGGLDRQVSLNQEIEYLKKYMYIMETRFGDKLSFSMDIDEDIDCEQVLLPKMTIQPLIESIYNSVNKSEEGGIIRLSIHSQGNKCHVEMVSDGSKIAISNDVEIKKVEKRLSLFLKKEEVLEYSEREGLNCIGFSLPKEYIV